MTVVTQGGARYGSKSALPKRDRLKALLQSYQESRVYLAYRANRLLMSGLLYVTRSSATAGGNGKGHFTRLGNAYQVTTLRR